MISDQVMYKLIAQLVKSNEGIEESIKKIAKTMEMDKDALCYTPLQVKKMLEFGFELGYSSVLVGGCEIAFEEHVGLDWVELTEVDRTTMKYIAEQLKKE